MQDYTNELKYAISPKHEFYMISMQVNLEIETILLCKLKLSYMRLWKWANNSAW